MERTRLSHCKRNSRTEVTHPSLVLSVLLLTRRTRPHQEKQEAGEQIRQNNKSTVPSNWQEEWPGTVLGEPCGTVLLEHLLLQGKGREGFHVFWASSVPVFVRHPGPHLQGESGHFLASMKEGSEAYRAWLVSSAGSSQAGTGTRLCLPSKASTGCIFHPSIS